MLLYIVSLIYNKDGLNDKNYVGVPTLIVEILSLSNVWWDTY